jgi:hypothetical protein
MRDDDIIRRIQRFHFHRAPIAVERRGKGYTLFHADTGHPIARLRPYGRDDLMEIFYWSLWRERWRPTGPFGCTVVPLKEALRIIDAEPIFAVGH